MLVYIFNESVFTKMLLPSKIKGIYQLFASSNEFLANIEELNGVWHIRNNNDIELLREDKESLDPELVPYERYVIKNKLSGKSYYIMATPLYDSRTRFVSAVNPTVTIGASSNDDICFNNPNVMDCNIKLNFKDNFWHLEAATNNVYVCGKGTQSAILKYGDYLFLNGLKVVIIGKFFIINNPNDQVSLKSGSFEEKPVDVLQDLVEPPAPIADDIPIFGPQDYFIKSPRFKSQMKKAKVAIDSPPAPEMPDDTPVILTIGPQITMISTSVITLYNYIGSYLDGTATLKSFVMSMITVGVTLISTLLWPNLTRFINNRRIKKKEKKRQRKYSEYLDEKSKQLELIKAKQRQVLIDNNTSLENCALYIANKSRNLWERNIDHDDFLQIRLGVGKVETQLSIDDIQEQFTVDEKDTMEVKRQEIIKNAKYIDNAPLSIKLTEKYLTGVTGPDVYVKAFLDSVFLQIMTFHSFTELKIVVFTNKDNERKWDYLRVLPHCWNNFRTLRYFATTTEEMNTISTEIEDVFNNRVKEDESETLEDNGDVTTGQKDYKSYRPYYLIFTDDITIARNVGVVKKILSYRKNMGFSLLMANDRLSTLPSETSTFINIDEKTSGLIGNELIMDESTQFVAEFNTKVDVYNCAAKLANIPIQTGKAKYELPSSISFLTMYKVGKVEQLNSLERWVNNNPVNSLSVPVGIDQNGELFKVDLHEKAFGPHGLVAGTTGSGKSEWIVTYILSLAVNFQPDEVQFVLIDYKGGGLAMSFENQEMGIKLPHLAGTITNLDKSAVNRAIASIESELKRRQSVFNAAREKLKESSMNIYKYQQFYRKGMVDQPLSHLFIISDEFAELKQQQPEFMEQLISTSRIGRSLGVHLILATQKPSGVVNDQIWSNSRFKICFRVQDKGDSNEILKKPDAAYLKQVGSFYFEVGNDEFYQMGQSAWAGAKYYPSDVIKKDVDQSVQQIDNLGRAINEYSEDVVEDVATEAHGEELLNVIQYIDNISKTENFVKTQLWLPNIPSEIYLSDVVKRYNHKPEKMKFDTVIGEYDEPRKQEQGVLKVDLAQGNIAIMGQAGAGTDELVSTIIWSSVTEHSPSELNYYIVDFGAETLRMYAKFPQVGEVVFQDDMERVAGVIQLVFEELEKRKELLADYNGSIELYNKTSGEVLPYIVLVINAFDVFSENLGQVAEALNGFFRDGPRYGLISILSASTANALRQKQLQYFNHVIVMQMKDDSAYRNITNCRRGLIPSKALGRGICKIGDTADSYCEFQTAFIAPTEQLVSYVRQTADRFAASYKTRAKQLPKIPDNVTSEDLEQYVTTLESVPIGFNFYEKDIAKVDLSHDKIYLVGTKDLKGSMSFLYGFANIVSKIPNTKVRVIDMESQFTKPLLDIKYFNEDLDTVYAALESDVLKRNETQDMAINFIIGAGSYKKTLSKAGVEIANNMFENIPNAKKSLFILVDNYDRLKTLKLETWYNYIDTSKGMWLGLGFDNQSLLMTNDLTEEDKKYDYEGLGFVVSDSKYTLIKTMLDGDE